MVQRLQTIEHGNHIIAVYPNKDEKFNEAFAFLKEGLQRNEVVVLTTADLLKDEILARMRKEWEVDVKELESRGDIIIITTGWYETNLTQIVIGEVCLELKDIVT